MVHHLVPLSSAQFWFTANFITDYGVHGEKLQAVLAFNRLFWKHLPSTMKQVGKFGITIGLVMPTFGSFAHHG